MDIEHLQKLIRMLEDSDLSEIEIEEEGRRIRLRKGRPRAVLSEPQLTAFRVAETAVAPSANTAAAALRVETAAASPLVASAVPESDATVTINSPMVGVFYSGPAPGEPPFVRPGDTVDENQTVCVVEAMKLMNEVTAKFPAVIEKALVENGEPVEYGQPLFAVRPIEQV